ncbi:hypothetical protein ACN28E_12885 [Archangium lansingense]|uniref:hypothetical protein n=1 Tax=Archangium lansingense TaxID=2995310 RepID=UPI003B7A0A7B
MTADTSDAEHLALLAAIGRAVGQDTPYEERHGERAEAISFGTMQRLPADASLEVLGGLVDPETGRVAWIEQQSGIPQSGYVPVSIDLHVAWRGQRLTRLEVPTYNPYFGCRLQFMRWYGETLSFIYLEKHRTIAARMEPPYAELELVALESLGAVDGDAVYFVSERAGLLEGRMLPSLEPALPLPVPDRARRLEVWGRAPGVLALAAWPRRDGAAGGGVDRGGIDAARAAARSVSLPPPEARALVGTPERVWARLHELLAETQPPRFGGDVLVGSVATPYWLDGSGRGTRYEDLRRYWNSPAYLAVYWHAHLLKAEQEREAQAWLHWLERVAALEPVEPEAWMRGLRGEELTARTALMYLRDRAAVLARVCRTGKLPEGEHCYLFSGDRVNALLERDEPYPSGFRAVLRQVVSGKPESLSDAG